jgi:hypothetical protein
VTKKRIVGNDVVEGHFGNEDAVAIDLLDGGTIGVYPHTFDSAFAYRETVTSTKVRRDEFGALLYNQKSGAPIEAAAFTELDEIKIALSRVAYVKNLELPGGQPYELLASSEEDAPKISAFLKLMNTVEIPLDARGEEYTWREDQVRASDANVKKKTGKRLPETLRITEPIFRTVLREASRLRREINARLVKNSSPTQSADSVA